jgi:glutathione S-transferase
MRNDTKHHLASENDMPRIDRPASPLVAKLDGLHLFHFDAAPCAQRVRFALAEKGLRRGREVRFDAADPGACAGQDGAWISRIVSLIKRDHLTPAYAQIQPNMVVPALVHDGVLYTESMDIIAYLDSAFGGEPLIPADPRRADDAAALVDEGKRLHVSLRYVSFRWGLGALGKLKPNEEAELHRLAAGRGDGENLVAFYDDYDRNAIPDSIYLSHLRTLERSFESLEARLADGRAYLTGDSLTAADVLWAMKVMRLHECGYPFAERVPALFEWYRRVARRPSFRAGVMGRHWPMHIAFRAKAGIENLLGVGLRRVAA